MVQKPPRRERKKTREHFTQTLRSLAFRVLGRPRSEVARHDACGAVEEGESQKQSKSVHCEERGHGDVHRRTQAEVHENPPRQWSRVNGFAHGHEQRRTNDSIPKHLEKEKGKASSDSGGRG